MLTSLLSLLEVIIIDMVMSGDNAVAIALPIRHLRADQQKKALLGGLFFAAFFRIILAFIGINIIHYPIIKIISACLLGLMTFHLGYTVAHPDRHEDVQTPSHHSLKWAMTQIIIADISTSVENILAVTSAAYSHPYAMVTGILLSIIMVGTMASGLSKLLAKYPFISWIGVIIIFIVAIKLGYDGVIECLFTTP